MEYAKNKDGSVQGVIREPAASSSLQYGDQNFAGKALANDQEVMEVVKKRHERMYLFSKAILMLDSALPNPDDYWSSQARKLFNLNIVEAKLLCDYAKCSTLR